MIIAPVIIFFLISGAINNIGNGSKDINKPIPWIIIITIFTPIAAGLMIFGYYAIKGEYDKKLINDTRLKTQDRTQQKLD